jgi:ubiquinone/menaquinone biosynthesis C-methylase UbiE
MTVRHPLAFPLGLVGMALLRGEAGEFPDEWVVHRIAEVRALLAAYDAGDLGGGQPVGQTDTVTGYRIWSATYDEFNPLIAVEQGPVRALIDRLPAGRALDAACGTGRWSAYLASRGHRVVGVDTSPDMLDRARAKVATATFTRAALTALPLPDDAVDLVVCALALPHMPDLRPVFAEFARVLRPGGRVITSDIHWQSLYLGGIASAVDGDAIQKRMPAGRYRPSDYLAAALPLGLQVTALQEPRWPPEVIGGGPVADRYARAATVAAYENTPAAIIWEFRLPGPGERPAEPTAPDGPRSLTPR